MSAMTAQRIIIVGSGGSVAAAGLLKNPDRCQHVLPDSDPGRTHVRIGTEASGSHPSATAAFFCPGSRRCVSSEFAVDGQPVECRQHDDLDPIIAGNGVVEGPEGFGVERSS